MGVKVKERVPGSGVWWLFINHNGHRKAKLVGSQEAANLAARKIEARLTLGEPALPEKPVEKELKPTVEEYYKTFEATHMATAIRPSTARQYRINFRVHILPELGKIPIDEVSRERVKAFIGHLCAKRIKAKAVERPLAKDSVRMILAALSCCFTCAQDAGLVLVNPATRMAKNYRQTRRLREEIQFLTAAQVPLFLKTALEIFPERYPLFLCATHTGLRSGELAGLQWGDLDFNGSS